MPHVKKVSIEGLREALIFDLLKSRFWARGVISTRSMGFLASFGIVFALFSSSVFADDSKNPNIARAVMGQGLYAQTGANSCLYCHGATGEAGKVKNAANLSTPKAWKIYKVLGGDAAYAKDPAAFKKKLQEATVHLMLKGAIVHNSSFKKDWFSLKAVGPYDGQMLGMTAAPSRKWLKKYKKKYGLKKEVAAESLYLYLKTLDKQKVL